MKSLIVLFVLLFSSSFSYADEFDTFTPTVLDVSFLNITKDQAHRSVLKALLLKNWKISSIDKELIKMSYHSDLAQVDLSQFPKIILSNTPDSEESSTGYFETLRRNIYADLVFCMN